MNNLILTTVLLASGALVFISAKERQQNIVRGKAGLVQHVESLRLQLEQRQAAGKELEEIVSTRKFETGIAREGLSLARFEAFQAIPPAPDPVREGFWPADQPYFHLAKRYLREIEYKTFSREQEVTRAAAILFGMTPREKAVVEIAARRFQTAINRLEFQNAEKIEEPSPGTLDHRQVSFRLQPIAAEEIRFLRRAFERDLNSALGPERADLFVERAVGQQSSEWASSGKTRLDKVVTLAAERREDGTVLHRIEVKTGGAHSSATFSFPLQPWNPLSRWRHLFGDEPLLETERPFNAW